MAEVNHTTAGKPQSITRPPVVVVLGHVDHGKTTLLDFIRKTNVAGRESGGITQHIGAYQVEHNGRAITFIDTPGHEAFSKMRSRGARVADIAVLVVAADEGMKPQTKESLEIVREAGTALIVALNKMDKPAANTEKVKTELTEAGVLLEGWGGDVPNVAISAKTGEGVPELLETALLLADVLELKADPTVPAQGVVIDAHRDSRRGSVATLLVQEGTLRIGDTVSCGALSAKIRMLEDFRGVAVTAATPSMPVVLLGFQELPTVGERFWVGERLARVGVAALATHGILQIQESSSETLLPLVIKADTQGSLEAIEDILRALPVKRVGLKVLSMGVGDITEHDVNTALAHHALILGFRVRATKQVTLLAEQHRVSIKTVKVIYEIGDIVKASMKETLGFEMLRTDMGTAEILALFQFEGKRMVVGGKVAAGEAVKGTAVEIMRRGNKIGKGKLVELQQNKMPVDRVEKGNECGMLVEGDTAIQTGDILNFYTEERREKELE